MNPDSNNYSDWLRKADDDDRTALSILKHRDGAPSVVCFLSQQMSEKYLKGLLVYRDKPFRKVHDLIDLETLLSEFYGDIESLHDDFALLNRYYIKTRYPGDYPDFGWSDAERAYETAKRVKEFVLEKVQ